MAGKKPQPVTCPGCLGNKTITLRNGKVVTCPTCNGTGKI